MSKPNYLRKSDSPSSIVVKYGLSVKPTLWNKTMVKMAVKKGVITKEQFKEITGEDF